MVVDQGCAISVSSFMLHSLRRISRSSSADWRPSTRRIGVRHLLIQDG